MLPSSALATLVAFIPKPSGGHRGIALIDALYRLILAWQRPALAAWTAANVQFWDDAVKGSTPLRAALVRSTLLEAASKLQLPCALALWDIEAYFDSFSVSDVARLATRLGYPQRLLLLALQLHTSTRLLTCGGSTIALGGISEGVLAGDPQSMAFAKLATFELLDELHRGHGPAAPRAYVDDMAMMLVELTQSALLGTLRPAVFRFVEELGRLGLRISQKSTLCPTTSSAVRALQAALLQRGGRHRARGRWA